ncbi:MAG: hypothetical protein V4590_00970 [Bacteroidota bacterium]
MKRSTFLLVTALVSFTFGTLFFFMPNLIAGMMSIEATPQILSVYRGMGGLIIGGGIINYFLRNQHNSEILTGLFLTNMLTHFLGLSADLWGVADGVLSISKMALIEVMHLFIGIGSFIYLLKMRTGPKQFEKLKTK